MKWTLRQKITLISLIAACTLLAIYALRNGDVLQAKALPSLVATNTGIPIIPATMVPNPNNNGIPIIPPTRDTGSIIMPPTEVISSTNSRFPTQNSPIIPPTPNGTPMATSTTDASYTPAYWGLPAQIGGYEIMVAIPSENQVCLPPNQLRLILHVLPNQPLNIPTDEIKQLENKVHRKIEVSFSPNVMTIEQVRSQEEEGRAERLDACTKLSGTPPIPKKEASLNPADYGLPAEIGGYQIRVAVSWETRLCNPSTDLELYLYAIPNQPQTLTTADVEQLKEITHRAIHLGFVSWPIMMSEIESQIDQLNTAGCFTFGGPELDFPTGDITPQNNPIIPPIQDTGLIIMPPTMVPNPNNNGIPIIPPTRDTGSIIMPPTEVISSTNSGFPTQNSPIIPPTPNGTPMATSTTDASYTPAYWGLPAQVGGYEIMVVVSSENQACSPTNQLQLLLHAIPNQPQTLTTNDIDQLEMLTKRSISLMFTSGVVSIQQVQTQTESWNAQMASGCISLGGPIPSPLLTFTPTPADPPPVTSYDPASWGLPSQIGGYEIMVVISSENQKCSEPNTLNLLFHALPNQPQTLTTADIDQLETIVHRRILLRFYSRVVTIVEIKTQTEDWNRWMDGGCISLGRRIPSPTPNPDDPISMTSYDPKSWGLPETIAGYKILVVKQVGGVGRSCVPNANMQVVLQMSSSDVSKLTKATYDTIMSELNNLDWKIEWLIGYVEPGTSKQNLVSVCAPNLNRDELR